MPKDYNHTQGFKTYNPSEEELKQRELRAKYEVSSSIINDLQHRYLNHDYDEEREFYEQLNKQFKEHKKLKKSKKKFLFVTVSFDEKLVTPTGTVAIIKKICNHPKVTNYRAYWEWRDVEKETGLHCHILLQGDTRRINEYLGRQKGPFIKLCSAYKTVKKYPIVFWNDKINYCEGKTNSEEKNLKKIHYPELRKKHNLPNLIH